MWLGVDAVLLLTAGERVAAKQANRMMAADLGSSKVSDTCQVPGFMLKPKQLPKSACANTGCAGAVLLRTIQGLKPTDKTAASFNLAEAASQCKANPVCVMFTSDGFLIEANRMPDNAKEGNEAISKERQQQGPLMWVPMDYCSGACCGTWVAEGLEQQMLSLAFDDSMKGADYIDLARDPTGYVSHYFVADAMRQFCSNTPRSVHVPSCAPSCHAACCALFATAGDQPALPSSRFMQCQGDKCQGCRPSHGSIIRAKRIGGGPAATAPYFVLRRQYLRAAAAAASPATATSGVPVSPPTRG